MSKEFYSSGEAAQILKISRISVFNRIKSGKIKAVKIGRNYVISRDAILEALGKKLGRAKKQEIEEAVERAIKDYGKTFKLLAKE